MTKRKIVSIGIIYFIFTLISFYIAIGGNHLYLSEREMTHWAIYYAILTFFFSLPLFSIIKSDIPLDVIKSKSKSHLFFSLLIFIFLLGITSLTYSYNFHTLVPFPLRMAMVGVEITLVFIVIYVRIGAFILTNEKYKLSLQNKEQQGI